MKLFFLSSLKRLFSTISSSGDSGKHALGFLNATQFLGVINDNLFKFSMAFLLIDTLGHDQASKILSATGAIYVIPFLLFSSSAGILADRFSKQKLLVVMKSVEIVVMVLAVGAFATKSVWGCYTLLFILSTHSAMFGPSKYGIIPELVPKDKVSRANGLITSFTYLAIIIGTFLAAFLTEVTNRHFVFIALFCLVVAVGGFFSSLGVKKTAAQGSKKKINIFFVREIYQTLKNCRSHLHLLPAILGSSYFLFIGAFTQLNIIPFAMESLNLSEVAGGYLFLATSLGIALGSYLAGKASRKRVELGLSCLAGLGIGLFFIFLDVFASHLPGVIICLIAIGVLGGTFIVPFDTFIQLSSDNAKRGQTIAAANFLSFSGVLVASFALYLFNQIFDLSSSTGFTVIGFATLLLSLALIALLSDLSLPFFSRKILFPILRCASSKTETLAKTQNAILILEKFSWKKALLLAGTIPNVHFILPENSKKRHWFLRFFYSFHIVHPEKNASDYLSYAKTLLDRQTVPCLLIDQTIAPVPQEKSKQFQLFKGPETKVAFAHLIRDPRTGRSSFDFIPK
ncbi:MAG: MFS transporter [Chlamydiota bacterium]